MQSSLLRGPNIIAILIPNRTIYDCNPFENGANMIAMSKIVLGSRDYDFWTNLVKINFSLLPSYVIPFISRLHSYKVLILIIIAIYLLLLCNI